MSYKLLDIKEFKKYIDGLKITRKINAVQLHHTYAPAYAQFKGDNHLTLQNNMKNFHVKSRGFTDIAQTFTIFPDGKICTGRDINKAPAGIYGANTNGICIECIGNFDVGGDAMSDAQKDAIVGVTKILLDKFGLDARTGVTYHCWWTSGGTSLGTYVKGKSAKTCPGTNFFGGNTKDSYIKNLMPLILNYGKEEKKMNENIVYNSIGEVPEWARPTIAKLVEKGYLKGDESGKLNLDTSMIRILVIIDRTGIFDN